MDLFSKSVWSIVSNAFGKSRNMPTVLFFSSQDNKVSDTNFVSALIVECFVWNPH